VPFDPVSIYRALDQDDVLAAGVARLGLFTDPRNCPQRPMLSAGGISIGGYGARASRSLTHGQRFMRKPSRQPSMETA
jgi:hypothetical protein